MRVLFLGILFSIIFVSCQEEKAGTNVSATPDTFGEGSEPKLVQPFEDTVTLINGRSLLITHMTEVENLSIPSVDTWEPDGTYLDGDWQVHQLRSGEWLLTMASLREERDPSMYRVRLSGPNAFNYAADIYADGTITPNQ